MDDPFALLDQFAFSQPKRQRIGCAPAAGASAGTIATQSTTVNQDAYQRMSTARPIQERLVELMLITTYRAHTSASVDAFHAFLISLGEGNVAHGRFWALVACLLSVQCRDSVALNVTQALMRRSSNGVSDGDGGAAGVLALSISELEDTVRHCNVH